MDVYGFWQEMKLTEKYSAELYVNLLGYSYANVDIKDITRRTTGDKIE